MSRPARTAHADSPNQSASDEQAAAESAEPEPESEPCPTLLIDIVEDGGDWSVLGSPEALQPMLRRIASFVAKAPAVADRLPSAPSTVEVVIVLSDDGAVAALNEQFRGMAKPTNVLSFPAAQSGPTDLGTDAVSLGDIVLALETVLREAADLGIPPADHLSHLVVHGLLHLLGYDHIEERQAEEMEALETRILAGLDIPDPYAGSEPVTAMAQ